MDRGLIALAAALSIAFAAGMGALGISLCSGKAFESMARQPEQSGKIQTLLFAAIVFIESMAIYALVVSLMLLFVFK